MLMLAKDKHSPLAEEQILKLHKLFYALVDEDNAGTYRKERVFITGTDYTPPAPDKMPAAMKKYVAEVSALRGAVHPIEYAALVHKGLVDVHPFVDGNGRTARLLMNLALIQDGYGIAIIPPVRRGEYIDALRASQRAKNPDNTAFLRLIAECVIETQKDYCRLLNLPIRDDAMLSLAKKPKEQER
jgi:Fic family protein